MPPPNQVFFQTDDAWDFLTPNLETIDVRDEARALRFITSPQRIDTFADRHAASFRPYTLFGSGDFHHLAAVWTRQFTEPFVILSFDNHPDWDIRPPRWSCGAWVNRALENPHVTQVSVWGCDSFECLFPTRLLGNRTAALEGRLLVHPWARAGKSYPSWLSPLTAETWRSQFIGWLDQFADQKVYVTIDLDCLADSFTNWENGRFTPDDLTWALGELRTKMNLIGGDLCGAWSPASYATPFQKLAGWFDHPRVLPPDPTERRTRHKNLFNHLWPALTGNHLQCSGDP